MALQSVRLRRALTSLTTLHRSFSSSTTLTSPPLPKTLISPTPCVKSPAFSSFQTRWFTGTRTPLSSSSGKKEYRVYKEGDEITEDMVLFEGCDFNHWLITVDFPKDPAPTPEEMVATYERICAKGLNISIEEAKKRIYACSTTTYQGFQAVMTEEESERFKDVEGVVFVLPDSYIDPQNKQYGGDLYENGVITPRPPPILYRKREGGRFRDRNRNPDQSARGGQHGSPQYNQQGQGGWNPGPQQNYRPQQNYGPPQNFSPQQNYEPPQNQPQHQNYGPQQNQSQHQNYGPLQNHPQQQTYGPPQNYPQRQNYGPPQNYPQQQNYGPPQNYPPQQNYAPPGQGEKMPVNHGNYQAHIGGSCESNYNQGQQGNHYPEEHRGQRFSQVEQRTIQGEHADYAPTGQTGLNQGRY